MRICSCIAGTSVTGLMGTTHFAASSKAMTPALSREFSTSSALQAASRASCSRFSPQDASDMEPDLSMAMISAVEGRSALFFTSMVTGRIFSSSLPRYPPSA